MSPRKRSPRNAKNKGRASAIIVDKEYEAIIDRMSPNGKGMATIKGVLVFIANSKIGDRLKVKITSVDPFSADGKIIKTISSEP